jgi:hypothetical protein
MREAKNVMNRCKSGQGTNLGALGSNIWCYQSAAKVHDFLGKKVNTEMDYPPYTSNSEPSNFWLFPKKKNALEG